MELICESATGTSEVNCRRVFLEGCGVSITPNLTFSTNTWNHSLHQAISPSKPTTDKEASCLDRDLDHHPDKHITSTLFTLETRVWNYVLLKRIFAQNISHR
jgi:hypothetical protein